MSVIALEVAMLSDEDLEEKVKQICLWWSAVGSALYSHILKRGVTQSDANRFNEQQEYLNEWNRRHKCTISSWR